MKPIPHFAALYLVSLFISFTFAVAHLPSYNSSAKFSVSAKHNSSSKYSASFTQDKSLAGNDSCKFGASNHTKRARVDLPPELDIIRQWIQWSPFLQYTDMETVGWKQWAITDMKFYANWQKLGNADANLANALRPSKKPFAKKRADRSVDLQLGRTLVEFRAYHDQNTLDTPFNDYFKDIDQDGQKFEQRGLDRKFIGSKCFAVGIASGRKITRGFMCDDLSHLPYVYGLTHALVRNGPSTALWVVSYKEVACK